jgi:hypothetical protein
MNRRGRIQPAPRKQDQIEIERPSSCDSLRASRRD